MTKAVIVATEIWTKATTVDALSLFLEEGYKRTVDTLGSQSALQESVTSLLDTNNVAEEGQIK